MRHVPRFAVGTIQSQVSRDCVTWGLIAALHALNDGPVLFRSSCALDGHDASRSALGRASRHLDSWAMSRCDAVSALVRGAAEGETALVEGEFDGLAANGNGVCHATHSSLTRLCDWLDLPRIAIVDVRTLSNCAWPTRPDHLDGLLLDRVTDGAAAAYWQTSLESLWKAPVLGWLDDASPLRKLAGSLGPGAHPTRELCEALAARLIPTLRVDRLRALARRATPLVEQAEPWTRSEIARRFRIAVAYDNVYCNYYPETLDLLEAAGADLVDFSPLRSESIPEGADVVYFGCGHPEREADRIAQNHCLKQSLRCFAAQGGRIYAEGGGLAYLCREMILPCGRAVPMTGLLPATARWLPEAGPAEPTEVVFGASSWLVPTQVSLRGYRHPGWQIEPRGAMITYARGAGQRLDVLGRGNVIGSRVLVNLAANRHLLRRFFEPHAPVASSIRD